jgi:hypothetical protein
MSISNTPRRRWHGATLIGLSACLIIGLSAPATSYADQRPASDAPGAAERVTVDSFRRAETDTYFSRFVRDAGGVGRLGHEREVTPVDRQTVIRMNRDTLYSFGVFDLDAGPATITLPEDSERGRYQSLHIIDQDHFTPAVLYAPTTHRLTREEIGTRYVAVAIRTFANPNDPQDMEAAHALQDAITIEQPGGRGKFSVPDWDQASLTRMREALLAVVEASGGLDSSRMFGKRDEVDPVQHLLGSAGGWGGVPPTAAIYVGVGPERNDGQTPHIMTVADVPVDGFWSISVYNQDGFFEPNPMDAYTINNVTAQRNADGSVTIHFGGDDEQAPNYLPIMPGWNYLVRLYRPHPEILEGRWSFPEAVPVEPGR